MIKTVKYLLLVLLLSVLTPLYSQIIEGENLQIRLMVVGQGDPLYSLWGHTGIAIKDIESGIDVFYDFGNFNFEDDDFFTNFAMGRLLYIAWAAYTEQYIFSIKSENRNLKEYVLNLSPDSKINMYKALKNKAKPENRTYLYHHYNDNCSTRIRDYINIAVENQLKAATNYNRGSTFRKSFLRFTSHRKLSGSLLSLLQGPMIDTDVTLWQEMFLPEILGEVVSTFTYTNDKGETIPLVTEVNILNSSKARKPLADVYNPPYWQVITLAVLFSSFCLYANYKSKRGERTLFAFSSMMAGLILGFFGSVILFLAAFTNHSYSFNNMNLFMINPIAFLTIPAAIMYLKKGETWRKRLDILWILQLLSTAVMILIKVLTPVKQDNLIEIILILPILITFTPFIPHLFKKKNLLR